MPATVRLDDPQRFVDDAVAVRDAQSRDLAIKSALEPGALRGDQVGEIGDRRHFR
jgi:hypothetical protein